MKRSDLPGSSAGTRMEKLRRPLREHDVRYFLRGLANAVGRGLIALIVFWIERQMR
jgi:hypothetical protein